MKNKATINWTATVTASNDVNNANNMVTVSSDTDNEFRGLLVEFKREKTSVGAGELYA